MNALIRNIDPVVAKKLDELARKKGMSRNAFINNLLENFCAVEIFQQAEDKYINALKEFGNVLEENTNAIKRFENLIREEE